MLLQFFGDVFPLLRLRNQKTRAISKKNNNNRYVTLAYYIPKIPHNAYYERKITFKGIPDEYGFNNKFNRFK